MPDTGDYSSYAHLSEGGKKAYERFVKELELFKGEITFFHYDPDDVYAAFLAVHRDHPEFFWLDGGSSVSTINLLFGKKITYYPTTSGYEGGDIIKMARELEVKVEEIISLIPAGTRYYEKALFVHDYIVDNTYYDKSYSPTSKSAYSCLVLGKATCLGYSEAFQLLMKKLSIPCHMVTGSGQGSGHAWNYILIGSDYYYADITWDDPTYTDPTKAPKGRSYDYFLITTEELLLTHTLDEDQILPNCTQTKYNYFVYNGYYLEQYSFSQASKIISEQFPSGRIYLKFSSDEQLQAAKKDLFDNDRIWKIKAVKASGISTLYHSTSEEGLLLTISLD